MDKKLSYRVFYFGLLLCIGCSSHSRNLASVQGTRLVKENNLASLKNKTVGKESPWADDGMQGGLCLNQDRCKVLPMVAPGESAHLSRLPLLWTKRMKGAILDIVLSKDGKAISVATLPDTDIPGSSTRHLLTRYNEKGKELWSKVLDFPLKDQDVSEDGKLVVMTNHEGQLIALNSRGKSLWTAEALGKPVILDRTHQILCYHDDDSEPGVAFDVFDWAGHRVYSFPIPRDILSFKVSEDEKHIVLGLVGGKVITLNSDFKVVWEAQLSGEIIDLSVSNEETQTFKVAALLKGLDKTSKFVILDSKGQRVGEGSPSIRAIQVELSRKGDHVFYYGNQKFGQFVGGAAVPESLAATRAEPLIFDPNEKKPPDALGKEVSVVDTALKDNPVNTIHEQWIKGNPHSSEYSSSILVQKSALGEPLVILGFEELTLTSRKNLLLGFNASGHLKWNIALPADEGAYLYSHRLAVSSPMLVVGTDDGKLSAYRVE